jgi:hypothetical protein
MLRRVALLRTYVPDQHIASIIRLTKIDELGATLAVTTNVAKKQHFLQEPHGLTYQNTVFFLVTAVKTSNLTRHDISFLFT